MTTMKLRKPIQAHGETIAELKFKEPTGRDLMATGMPIYTDAAGNRHTDTQIVGALISRLAQIPTSSVGELSVPDFVQATGVVVNFFADATPNS